MPKIENLKTKFNWFIAPIIGFVLLIIGETVGILITDWIASITSIEMEILELFSFIFIALAVIVWARFVDKFALENIGLTRTNALRHFFMGWGIGALLLISCVIIMMWLGVVKIEGINFSKELALRLIILLFAWSVQSTTEEILCRGWLFKSIESTHKSWVATLVSSIFFVWLHAGNDNMSMIPVLDLFVFSLLGCLLVIKYKNIWLISGIHAAWNCFQGSIFSFPVSGSHSGAALIEVGVQGPKWLSGGDFGVEGSMVSVLIQVLVIVWLVYDLFYKQGKTVKLSMQN